jgi:hypothetical protein
MYQQLWRYKVEEKLYLGVREQKRLNTTGLSDWFWGCLFDYKMRGLKLGSWPLEHRVCGLESHSRHGVSIIRAMNHRPDDGGSTYLWNVRQLQRDYTALHPRRLWTSRHFLDFPFFVPFNEICCELSPLMLERWYEWTWKRGQSVVSWNRKDETWSPLVLSLTRTCCPSNDEWSVLLPVYVHLAALMVRLIVCTSKHVTHFQVSYEHSLIWTRTCCIVGLLSELYHQASAITFQIKKKKNFYARAGFEPASPYFQNEARGI